MVRFLLASVLLSSQVTSAEAQAESAETAKGDEIILGASLDPADCSLKTAAPITFEVANNPLNDLDGKCIALSGYWVARALFATSKEANKLGSNSSPRLAHRRVGIYGGERMLAIAPKRAKRYMVVGRIKHCETAWPDAMMVLGYCHYTGGPFVIISEAWAG